MKIHELNHVAIHVADVVKSCAFYENVLQLKQILRPGFKFPGAWYLLGEVQELHLIGERVQPVHSHSRGNHFALLVDNLDEWEAFFQIRGVTYEPRRTRPDGAYQIYVQDPDGHTIELCTPAGTAPKS